MSYLKLAQRNLWRNKRRTLITISSILFAVFFAAMMRSFQLGSYSLMIDNSIGAYSGYLQIQNPDYADDPSLDNTIPQLEEITALPQKVSNVKAVVPRLETFALASTGNLTKGALVLGILPESEKNFSHPQSFLVKYRFTNQAVRNIVDNPNITEAIKSKVKILEGEMYPTEKKLADALGEEAIDTAVLNIIKRECHYNGRFISASDSEVVVSSRLAKFLNLNVGDSIILMSQGYHGSSAAGIYKVAGLVKIPNPELDNKLIYMPLGKTQDFTGCYNLVSYWAINLKNTSDEGLQNTQNVINNMLDSKNVTVKTWKELNRVLVQQIESDNKSGIAFLVLLYFVVFFGIFGTVIMMIYERTHEFGVLISVGMQRKKLATLVFIELIFMALIGVVIGMGVSMPIIHYYHVHPIALTGNTAKMMVDMGFEPLMPMAPFGPYLYRQAIVVLVMVVLASIYPIRRIIKINVTDAIRHR